MRQEGVLPVKVIGLADRIRMQITLQEGVLHEKVIGLADRIRMQISLIPKMNFIRIGECLKWDI